MIRPYRQSDLAEIMALWLETTIAAHPFIDEAYWYQAEPLVAERYIPQSKTWVYESDERIVGFISILDERLIGALFVRQSSQRGGVGRALVEYVKLLYPLLLLEVYPQNQNAYRFYQRMGFYPVSQTFNDETGAMLATLCYQQPPASS